MKKENSTKQSVLEAAAKIIKAAIRELNIPKTHYPNEQEIDNLEKGKQWVPESLSNFLGQIVHSDLKNLSIGQCVVQAARPRTLIVPIKYGLGVQVEKSFGSKWLVNHLSKLGFSITAEEILRYKQSVIENMDVELSEQMQAVDEEPVFVQWVADSVDHNTATLSGKGTFHCMGIVSTSIKPLQGRFGNIPCLQQ